MLNNQQIQIECNEIFTPEQILENRGRVAIFIDGRIKLLWPRWFEA